MHVGAMETEPGNRGICRGREVPEEPRDPGGARERADTSRTLGTGRQPERDEPQANTEVRRPGTDSRPVIGNRLRDHAERECRPSDTDRRQPTTPAPAHRA